jgi:hypothetical protein
MGASRNKKILGIAIVAVMVVVAISAAYVPILQTLYPPHCVQQSFGTNLGFETGNLEGWTNPIGFWEVIGNTTHSGKYAAYAEMSSMFSAEIYQNWKVEYPSCELYLSAYVFVVCPMDAGIMVREIDMVELSALVCSGYPPLHGQDAVLARVRIGDAYTDSYITYHFAYSQWYKFSVSVRAGRIGYYVNDQLIHIENRTVRFSNPSFGAGVSVYTATYFDDFAMSQRNASSSPSGMSSMLRLCSDLERSIRDSIRFPIRAK